uniref:Uncharacterized protein n=1 Tax=Glossina pallidipes TaxID=7398 RepID=A0A1B0A466_GLOPL
MSLCVIKVLAQEIKKQTSPSHRFYCRRDKANDSLGAGKFFKSLIITGAANRAYVNHYFAIVRSFVPLVTLMLHKWLKEFAKHSTTEKRSFGERYLIFLVTIAIPLLRKDMDNAYK